MWKNQLSASDLGIIDIRKCHGNIASNFYRDYRRIWDTNFPLVNNLYSNNSLITYLGRKFNNVNSWINYVKNYQGVWKFEHINYQGTSQPLNNNTILINIIGTISANDCIYWKKYSETVIIRRNIWDKWYVTNSIFSLIL